MSFDLAVFRSSRPLSDTEALQIYKALCSKTKARVAGRALEATPDLEAFYRALTKTYPEIDEDEESPFAVEIERRPYAVILNLSFSRVDDVVPAIEELAQKHKLDVFDPQAKRLRPTSDPTTALSPAPPKKLKPKEGLALFVAGIEPALAKLGFTRSAKARLAWSRTLPNAVVHELSLNLGTRNVRPNVGVGHTRALEWMSVATGVPEPPPEMPLEYLFFRGWIPEESWRPSEVAFNHEICHCECVDKSVKRYLKEVKRYAIPFFDALATVEQIRDFFERRTTFSEARPNWTIEREAGPSGPAERFWRPDRAILLETAVGVLADPSSLKRRIVVASRREKALGKKKLFGWTPALAAQIVALGRAARD